MRQAQSQVSVVESSSVVVKPRGKLVIYTETSYKLAHAGRSCEEDGLEPHLVTVKPGQVIAERHGHGNPMDRTDGGFPPRAS
jgi:hypothetical protein